MMRAKKLETASTEHFDEFRYKRKQRNTAENVQRYGSQED